MTPWESTPLRLAPTNDPATTSDHLGDVLRRAGGQQELSGEPVQLIR
jgi:hypothetical protein